MTKEKFVFFSQVGMSDPIRKGYDGPLLHIIRYYQPEKVYIFFSKETQALEEQDQRYTLAVKAIAPECEIQLIASDIAKVQDFDIFMDKFPEEIEKIHKAHPEHTILLNLTSGTPQMLTSLAIECFLTQAKCLPIQVITPEKKSNPHEKESFSLDDIENNLDNLSESENRCVQVNLLAMRNNNFKQQLKVAVETYNYEAALAICKLEKNLVTETVYKLIEHAKLRSQLQIAAAKKVLPSYNGQNLFPVEQNNLLLITEQFMSIQVRQARGELADFFLRMTPFLYALAKYYLQDELGFDLTKICSSERNGKQTIKIDKLQKHEPNLYQYINKNYGGNFRDSALSFANILHILRYLQEQNVNKKISVEVVNKIEELRTYEDEIRNTVAHDIKGISEENIAAIAKEHSARKLFFKKHKTSKALLEDMRFIMLEILATKAKGYKFMYDEINKMIKLEL